MTEERPKLTRPSYHVWTAPTGTDPNTVEDDQLEYHRVVVNGTDQLRAELEARRLGLPEGSKAPMHLTALWLWAAMTRTQATAQPFPEWKHRLVNFDPTDRDDPRPDQVVDPTAASTS